MSKVFVDIGMSLDGCIAGPNAGPDNPLGDGGVAIHQWLFKTAAFLERIGGTRGETSPDDAIVKEIFARAGAYVMGRRMFDEGEVGWPEEAPFRAPVFVLTHEARQPWVRKGGTTFHFVTDGIFRALEQARAAAGGKDVRVSGGAATIRQFMAAGFVEELTASSRYEPSRFHRDRWSFTSVSGTSFTAFVRTALAMLTPPIWGKWPALQGLRLNTPSSHMRPTFDLRGPQRRSRLALDATITNLAPEAPAA